MMAVSPCSFLDMAFRFDFCDFQVRVQCRGQCSSLGAPHTFGDYELKKALGYIPPCPKCSDDSISLENTGYMIGEQKARQNTSKTM